MKSRQKKQKLNIRDVNHLCMRLGISIDKLDRICANINKYYRCWDAERKGKIRPIATPTGQLRPIVNRLNTILQELAIPDNIHGGVKGRSTISYAKGHIKKPVLVKTDLKDCFPSIKSSRIYRLFYEELGCSPDVARYLTHLTTFKGALPQGSPTSTILAALTTRQLAKRLEGLSKSTNGRADLYVDDIVFSGPGYAGKLKNTMNSIINQEGFRSNPSKTFELGRKKEQVLTGIRVNDRLDVPKDKVEAAKTIINDLGYRKTKGENISERELRSIKGKIRYIASLNRGAGQYLSRQLNSALSK